MLFGIFRSVKVLVGTFIIPECLVVSFCVGVIMVCVFGFLFLFLLINWFIYI